MSLSDRDLRLVGSVLPGNTSLTNFMDFRCSHEDLSALLDAARAEGRPSPEELTPVRDVWRNQSLSRIDRVRAHRAEFGSELKAAIEAVDQETEHQRLAALSTPSPEPAEGAPAAWRCGAIANPEDCGWPFCGCDPTADKVLSAIQEHDMLIVPNTLSADAEPAAVSQEEIAGIIRDHVSLTCGIHCERMMSSDDERQCEFDAANAIISRIGGPSPEAGREESDRALPKIASARICFGMGWQAGYESALKGSDGPCMDAAFKASGVAKAIALSPQSPEREVKEALNMTGLRTIAEVIDMANVGQSLMENIALLKKAKGPFKDWTPADDPAEIVFDLVNHYEDAAALSPPAPEPGYEAEPKAIKTVGWAALASNGNIRFWLRDREPVQEFANRYGCDVVRLVASPVPVSREEIAEEIWRRFAPSYEETFAECANRSEYLLAADAILQRLSNQQKEA